MVHDKFNPRLKQICPHHQILTLAYPRMPWNQVFFKAPLMRMALFSIMPQPRLEIKKRFGYWPKYLDF